MYVLIKLLFCFVACLLYAPNFLFQFVAESIYSIMLCQVTVYISILTTLPSQIVHLKAVVTEPDYLILRSTTPVLRPSCQNSITLTNAKLSPKRQENNPYLTMFELCDV